MNMRLDHLRTGLRDAPAQDAQEVGEVPLSISELIAVLKAGADLDLYDIEQAFASLVDNFNCGVCFAMATDYAVRAVAGSKDADIPPTVLSCVQETLAAPWLAPVPETFNEFSHVLPAIERGCRALEAGQVDRAAFTADVEEIALLYYMADLRAMTAVCRYMQAALPSIRGHRAVPALGADFNLDGIPLRKYKALGAALLQAIRPFI